jgi:hypothetical protein
VTDPVRSTAPHADPAACKIENGLPAMVSEAERSAPVFAGMLIDTVPLPLPEVPDGNVSQPGFPVTLQPQPEGAVTCTEAVPPPAPKDCELELME